MVTQLGVLQQQGVLGLWDDRRIGAGEEWFTEIQQAIEAASVAVLLVSAHSLTSNFILREEVQRLLERRDAEGLRVFPIIISPCAWNAVDWLCRMQLRPKDGRPIAGKSRYKVEAELATLTEEIRVLLSNAAQPAEALAGPGPDAEEKPSEQLEDGARLAAATLSCSSVADQPEPRSVALLYKRNAAMRITRDTYISRNAGAVGPNATAHNTTITENHGAPLAGVDLSALAAQLGSLKQAMKADVQDTSHFEATAEISAAEDAAKKNDGSTAFAKLKAAGTWAFETATKIGVSVAAEALKKAIGLG